LCGYIRLIVSIYVYKVGGYISLMITYTYRCANMSEKVSDIDELERVKIH